jgi:mycothiol synthase
MPHRLEHGLTAERHSHRRRGLGTALKRAQIAWAAEHGYCELVTDMVEGNAAMRAVNERPGYRPLPPVFIVSGSAS